MKDKFYDDDIPQYKKKKNSNKSKSKEKSKHKHEYEDCLLIVNMNPHRAKYCKICGRISNVKFYETRFDEDSGVSIVMDKDEIFEKYAGLPKIDVDTIWDKYVSLDKRRI